MKAKKRYRLTVWQPSGSLGAPAGHWVKTETRLLDAKEADLLKGVAWNLGFQHSWCNTAREVSGRPVSVETL